jgi:hypothetical protein
MFYRIDPSAGRNSKAITIGNTNIPPARDIGGADREGRGA